MTPPSPTSTGVHASERDQLLAAAIKFIADLTGMKPPPIETAPADVFAPFHSFVDEVQGIVSASRGAGIAPNAASKPDMPVIYVDGQGKLVSRVSGEQVEAVLGPIVDEIRTSMARQSGSARLYAGEGPISALYGIRYFATDLAEAQTIASDAMDTARRRISAARSEEPASKASASPNELLWDRKGNVIHAAVDRLGAAQRAAAAEHNAQEGAQEAPRP